MRKTACILLLALIMCMMVACGSKNSQDDASISSGGGPEYSTFEELSGKTVSMLTGAPFEELVKSKNPDVGGFTSFNSTPDMLLALESGKTDAVLTNNAIAALAVNRNQDLALFPQELKGGTFGLAFEKGDARCDDWQAALDAIPEEAVEAAWEKWTGADESVKVLPAQDWPGANGTVRVAACDTLEPMSYVGGDGEPKGFDLEMILMIAKEMDMHVEFTSMEFSAILASVQSGKADIGAGSIIITEERAQAVDFVEYYPAAFVLIVRNLNDAAVEVSDDERTDDGIAFSFEKTFLREDRWKLFVSGVLITLIITLLSIIFGTILGFAVFMLCRDGNPAANLVTRFCLWLVQGMPMVVLLMILYYIIFGKVAIDGVAVAVIGFTLTFGATVFGLLKMGVGAVDIGQYEAAYALGYSKQRTFFKIILPQALPHVLPAYKGEIVGLIKATAIVGYIAVQDLTKMGDIVRSRTYEAFFPLIAVTVIYFLLEALIGLFVLRISVNFNPKRRRKEDILKGVRTHD
ncbi:MAG: transporter substrate-binding domain-containing protein [Butyrivibrio sp.]|nr:transporter substrate-binding domain-containing protein [Butyrivibrio sp.]